jgi:lipoate-protein ligase A
LNWAVERTCGSAAAFHARPIPEPVARAVWLFAVERPALVLGSTQADAVADADACTAAGVDLVRRRSGGGAVLLVPGEVLWVDVVVPVGDPLWSADVGVSTHWLGAAWARALAAGGASGAAVHRGPMVRTPWSTLVCFAGLAPGEVTIGARKVVGISQRRTRVAARFQCAALARWDAAALTALLAPPLPPTRGLAGVAAGVGVSLDALSAAFLAALPA